MTWTRKRMGKLIETVRVAIRNLFRFPEIKDRLLRFGFTDEKLTNGLALADNAESLYIGRRTKFGLQMTATKKLLDMIDAVFTYYMDYASMVKIRLGKDKQTLEVLGLRGKRIKSLMGLLLQARQFFQALIDNPDILAFVADQGITQQVIDDGLAKLDTLESENEFQEALKGDAQNTTQLRNKAFDHLYDYWKLLKNAADREFVDEPQLKEKLEIKAYTPGYKKNKKTEEPTDQTQPDEPQTDPTLPVEQTAENTQEQQGT
jgi:hypothetical protein